MRTFSGTDEFKKLSDTVVDAYKKLFPVEKNGHRMEATKIWLDDSDTGVNDYADQKKVKLAGGTWGVPVMASVLLKDPTGKVVDKIDKIKIATVPRLTPRHSYIVQGNEYQVANQMIRKPGAYVVPSQKGDVFKGMVVLSGERQKNFDIHFDPQSNNYTVHVGQAKLPLFPLLKSLGANDKELENAFGEQVFLANKNKDKDHRYLDMAKKIAGTDTDNKQTAMESIAAFAKTTKVDPGVTEVTLGSKYEGLSKNLLLDTAKKVLAVYKGEKSTDDPENLIFKEIRSVEDMLHDRLNNKKEQMSLKRMLGRHLGTRGDLKKMIDFRKLTAPVHTFFTSDSCVSTPEQYNPVNMLSEGSKLTIHGTGGIESEHAVTDILREVHPSHIGFVDTIHTPESEKTGTTLHLSAGVQKNGREINTMVFNPKTGKVDRLSPKEVYFKAVAFPDEFVNGKFKNPSAVRVQQAGKVTTVPASKVEGILPTPVGLFSHATNLIPFLKNNQGARGAMASKMLGQALPLVEREAPLVQTEIAGGKTFHSAIGGEFSVRAPKSGTVKSVTADYIQIDNEKIPLYNNFPLNQKTHIHHEPTVKVGDKVNSGQLIADSNFTKNGTLALGKNMSVAYLPIPGHTFEDGIVITESASKKLAAEQTLKHSFRTEEGQSIVNLRKWIGHYGAKLGKDAYKDLNEDGIVRKGTVVQPGQILIAGLTNNAKSPENMTLKKINKSLMIPWADASVTYKGEFPGVVTDVVKRADGVHVLVKSVEPAKASDKLSGVHGNKGVISAVIPDHEAPRTADGHIPDIFLNPHGIISRINMGQLYESAAGKIAKKNGKTYVVKNFEEGSSNERIQAELKKAGLSDTEVLYDAKGNKLGPVHVGNPYILRLAKTGKAGFSARVPGTGYDNNLQPLKGGEEGTKSLDALTFYSMLSHGAKKNLIDAHQKSERNDEYWHAVEMGKPLPAPKETFAFQKFTSLLKGAGINVTKKGGDFTISPMTDTDVKGVSKGAVKDPRFFYGKNEKEIKDGFFDVAKSGGITGKNYMHLELPEVLPNPIFENAIKSLTGINKAEYADIIAGKKFVSRDGKITSTPTEGSKTGGEAIGHLLSKIDVESEYSKAKNELKRLASRNASDTDIEKMNRRVRYLSALKDLDLKPKEAYTRTVLPVIPPQYRPVQKLEGVGNSVAPANFLYQNVGVLADAHKYPVMKFLDETEKGKLRAETYKATKQLAGLESLEVRGKDQPIEGFVSQVASETPKSGFFLSKLITKKQDLVGRGVITNGPDLHVDELGIPEKMAWKIFRPFIIKEFITSGFRPDQARKEVDEKSPMAQKMLESVMKQRTVMMNRAPSLHKFSIMAFKPKMTDGLAIKVPPLVFKGFNADIDGDAVNIHVPVSEEAVRESFKMFPSNNLWKPGAKQELMMVPSQEAAIGMYFLSQSKEGRAQINKLLPPKFHIDKQLDRKGAKELYDRIAREDPSRFASLVGDLKSLGDTHAYNIGFTASIKDVNVDTRKRDAVFDKADKAVALLKAREKAGPALDQKIAAIYQAAAKDAYEQHIAPQLKEKGSSFYHMVNSGARGNASQLQQLVSAPGILKDSKDRSIPVPVKNSYAEGLTTSDYFIASYGVRKGMMDRALQTSKPGALNKDIIATAIDNIITKDDCGTKKGAFLSLDKPSDLYDRYLATDQGGFKRNTLVTPQLITSLKKSGFKNIMVRSPLGCVAAKGTCAHCFGINEHGNKAELGDNVGATMGQAMSERVTQMTMQCSAGLVTLPDGSACSFEDLYNALPCTEEVDGPYRTKTGSFSIVDDKEIVQAYSIQQHPAEDQMLFIKTKSGKTALVQANHPMWVYSAGYAEERLAAEIEEGDLLKVDTHMVTGSEDAPLDPYIIGLFLAAGTTRYGNGTEKYKNIPVASIITQHNNSIKDLAFNKLADVSGATKHDLNIQVYNPKFAAHLATIVRGRRANLKRLAPGFNKWKDVDLAQVLSGWVDGDGTVYEVNGTTVAKIYTTSYVALQQLEIICEKLGIKQTSYVVGERSIQRNPQFAIELRFYNDSKDVWSNSVKLSKNPILFGKYRVKNTDLDPVTYICPMWKWDLPVWDVKTSTAGYTCGMLRNHNTFHTGGIAGAKSVGGFTRVNQLLSMPKYVAGEAALAPIGGKVTKIEKSSAGGHIIHIGEKSVTSRPGHSLNVKLGDKVEAGDSLTDGVIKPQLLAQYKGMEAAQQYITDQLQKTYADQGVDMHRKVFETVVRSLANNTRVVEAPKHTSLLPGDLIPYTLAKHYNETRRVKIPVEEASGYTIEGPLGKLPAMHELSDSDISYLKSIGIRGDIQVLKDPLRHQPVLKSIRELPMLRKDWMAQLGYQKIRQGLTEGAAQAWKSTVEGAHPVPAFAYGATFGKKKEHY